MSGRRTGVWRVFTNVFERFQVTCFESLSFSISLHDNVTLDFIVSNPQQTKLEEVVHVTHSQLSANEGVPVYSDARFC